MSTCFFCFERSGLFYQDLIRSIQFPVLAVFPYSMHVSYQSFQNWRTVDLISVNQGAIQIIRDNLGGNLREGKIMLEKKNSLNQIYQINQMCKLIVFKRRNTDPKHLAIPNQGYLRNLKGYARFSPFEDLL